MKEHRQIVLVVFAAIILYPSVALAWLRPHYLDDEVVKRAELIIVAHIKEGSIVYVPHQPRNGGGASWEYHGGLIITEVLKGDLADKEIPITIHYGLTPVTGGYLKTESMGIDERHFRPDYPKDVIEIFDTAEFGGALTDDIRKDHVWFLRHHNINEYGNDERDDSTTSPGIWDPEDIQLLELKPYFQAFLTNHTVDTLTEFALEHSTVGARPQDYLNHLKMEAALTEPDLDKRAGMLLPFFLHTGEEKMADPTGREAYIDLICHCGQAGAALLVPIFKDPKYEIMQSEIMMVWLNTEYQPAALILIDLLRRENEFWAHQMPVEKNLWFDTRPDHQATKAQGDSEHRVESALIVLQHLPDIQAKPVVEETKRLWTEIQAETISDNVIRHCDEALASLQKP